ncbi:long-chain fatty acid--CoA ligase, partial [Natrinema soli]
RLVDDGGEPLEGAADGTLQLAGPMVADGYVDAAGTGDENWDEPAEIESREVEESGDRGRFVDGWFDTGDRFRRDADGNYSSR